jgi:small conductance mechanosensitive channel
MKQFLSIDSAMKMHWSGLFFVSLCLYLVLTLGARNIHAAESTPPAESAELAQLVEALERIGVLRPLVARFEAAHANTPPEDVFTRTVIDARLDRAWSSMVAEIHQAARLVAKLKGNEIVDSDQQETVEGLLTSVPQASFAMLDRLSREVSLPTRDQSAAEQAAVFANANIDTARVDALFDQILENLKLQAQFSLDTSDTTAELTRRLEARAEGTSAFLDVSSRDVEALSLQASVLPDDAEVAAQLAVARQRVALSVVVLRGTVQKMRSLGLDTREYETQLIARTGEITTDVLDVSVLGSLAVAAWQSMKDWIAENGAGLFFSLLIFLLILYVTFKVAAFVQRLVLLGVERSNNNLPELLKRMIVSGARGLIIALGLLIAVSQLGISLGPLLAGLGIAGFVIGFALQDTLSNFAAGMMILFYRPFDVGDVVEAGGVFGTVNHMSLVNTTILTFDNQTLVVPNTKIWGDVIKNLNSQNQRRVDMMFGIGYADDIPHAEQLLKEIVASHESVLAYPEPVIRLHELGESSVNFVVRPWVNAVDYWPVYWDITREVKMRFDAEGVSIPFPQRDVHLYTEVGQGAEK